MIKGIKFWLLWSLQSPYRLFVGSLRWYQWCNLARHPYSKSWLALSNKTEASYAFVASTFRGRRPVILSIRYTMSDAIMERKRFITASTPRLLLGFQQLFRNCYSVISNEHFQVWLPILQHLWHDSCATSTWMSKFFQSRVKPIEW